MSPDPADGPARLEPTLLLRAYAAGIFPMAEDADDPALFWVEPRERGVLPLDAFHVPRRLARTVRTTPWRVDADRDFAEVVRRCAASAPGRDRTWINGTLQNLYLGLHEAGHAHSVEVRAPDGALMGGLFGVALGGAFFGESMFREGRDASKIALVHLVARLRKGGFVLLDAQFLTEHLAQFGAEALGRARYRARLAAAIATPAGFPRIEPLSGAEALRVLGPDRG